MKRRGFFIDDLGVLADRRIQEDESEVFVFFEFFDRETVTAFVFHQDLGFPVSKKEGMLTIIAHHLNFSDLMESGDVSAYNERNGRKRSMFSENKLINTAYQRASRKLIVSCVCIAMGLGLLAYSVIGFQAKTRDIRHLNYIITSDEKDKTGRLAYGDFVGFFEFATYGEDTGYYIAYDEEFFYIMSMPEKDFDYFAGLYDDNAGSARIYGRTFSLPEEAKSYAISALNEEMETNYVTYSNFEDVFGDVCLAARKQSSLLGFNGYIETMAPWFIFSIFFLVGGILYLLISRKQRKDLDIFKDNGLVENEIVKQMNSENCVAYEKAMLALTDDYLVSLAEPIAVAKYSDIAWAYITRHRTNMISDYNYLNVLTKDGKAIHCANSSSFGKKNKTASQQFHEEILSRLAAKNENILFGYTEENREAYSSILKAR